MKNSYSDEIQRKRAEAAAKKQREQELARTENTFKESSGLVAAEVARQSAKSRTTTQKVKVENEDLAKKEDIDAVIKQLKEVQLATLLGGGQKPSVILADSTDFGDRISEITTQLKALSSLLVDDGKTDGELRNLGKKLDELGKGLSKLKIGNELTNEIKDLGKAISKIDVKPVIKVPAPNVTVNEKELDLEPLAKLMAQVRDAVSNIKMPESADGQVIDGLAAVKKSIDSIQFPIPNYILPYKDPATGKATQVTLTSDGKLPVDATVNVGSIGVIEDIQDGAGDSIMDATNNAMNVNIVAGSASGTQYTEGDTDASITGTALMMEDGSNTLRAATGNVANGLDVDVTRVSGTVTVDGSGVTQPVSNAGLTELAAAINSSKVDINLVSSDIAFGGTSAADDADFTAGTTAGTPAMGVYESTPTSVTDGDLGTVGITSGRRLKTSATIDAALPAGTNNIGDVDVLSSALPTGASTSANQTTIIGHLDGVEGLLTTIDGDTGTLAGAVSGSEMQVDVVTSALPSGAATSAKQDTEITALQLIDDVVYVDDADWTDDTSKHALVGGVYQSSPHTVTDGDVTPFLTDANGRQAITGTVTANIGTVGTLATAAKQDTGNTSLGTIDTSTAAAATSLAALDNSVDGNYLNTNMNIAGTDVVSGSGTATGALRVELPTNGTGVIATVGAVTAITNALPAGTNAIGKLAANSGVDIGDVDVTSVPRSMSGPGQPGTAIDSYTHAPFNLAAGANQVLVSSAASKQIWVYGIGFTVNVAGTVSFQDEDDTAITGVMNMAATGGMTVSPSGNFSMPIWKLGTDKDLEVDVVTSELDGWIDYAIVSV